MQTNTELQIIRECSWMRTNVQKYNYSMLSREEANTECLYVVQPWSLNR